MPALFICATKDSALPPSMSEGMEKYIPNYTRKDIEGSHWILVEKPQEVNAAIKAFLETNRAVKAGSSNL